jgi:hypothetical protein
VLARRQERGKKVTFAEEDLIKLFDGDDLSDLSGADVESKDGPSAPSSKAARITRSGSEAMDGKASQGPATASTSAKQVNAKKLRPMELDHLEVGLPKRNGVRKRNRSPSVERESTNNHASSSANSRTRAGAASSKPAPKKQRLGRGKATAPMIAAFPVDPPIESDVLGYASLLEPSSEAKTGTGSEGGEEGDVRERMVMQLELPAAVYDAEADEVNIEIQPFHFPYDAKVSPYRLSAC